MLIVGFSTLNPQNIKQKFQYYNALIWTINGCKYIRIDATASVYTQWKVCHNVHLGVSVFCYWTLCTRRLSAVYTNFLIVVYILKYHFWEVWKQVCVWLSVYVIHYVVSMCVRMCTRVWEGDFGCLRCSSQFISVDIWPNSWTHLGTHMRARTHRQTCTDCLHFHKFLSVFFLNFFYPSISSSPGLSTLCTDIVHLYVSMFMCKD